MIDDGVSTWARRWLYGDDEPDNPYSGLPNNGVVTPTAQTWVDESPSQPNVNPVQPVEDQPWQSTASSVTSIPKTPTIGTVAEPTSTVDAGVPQSFPQSPSPRLPDSSDSPTSSLPNQGRLSPVQRTLATLADLDPDQELAPRTPRDVKPDDPYMGVNPVQQTAGLPMPKAVDPNQEELAPAPGPVSRTLGVLGNSWEKRTAPSEEKRQQDAEFIRGADEQGAIPGAIARGTTTANSILSRFNQTVLNSGMIAGDVIDSLMPIALNRRAISLNKGMEELGFGPDSLGEFGELGLADALVAISPTKFGQALLSGGTEQLTKNAAGQVVNIAGNRVALNPATREIIDDVGSGLATVGKGIGSAASRGLESLRNAGRAAGDFVSEGLEGARQPSTSGLSNAVPRGWGDADAGKGAAEQMAEAVMPGRRAVGAVAGATAGFTEGDEDTTIGERIRNAGIGAVAGGTVVGAGNIGAAKLIDSLIKRGKLSADVLSGHPDTAQRIRAMFLLAAEGKPNDAVVQVPGIVRALARMEPEAGAAVSEFLRGPVTAGRIREIVAQPGALENAGQTIREIVIDAVTGVGNRGKRAWETTADTAAVRGRIADPRTDLPRRGMFGPNVPDQLNNRNFGVAVRQSDRNVTDFVHRVAGEMGAPPPTVYFSESPIVNAGAGLSEHGHPVIVLTRGLMDLGLNESEMRGLLMHELAHVGEVRKESIGRRVGNLLLDMWDDVRNRADDLAGKQPGPRLSRALETSEEGARQPSASGVTARAGLVPSGGRLAADGTESALPVSRPAFNNNGRWYVLDDAGHPSPPLDHPDYADTYLAMRRLGGSPDEAIEVANGRSSKEAWRLIDAVRAQGKKLPPLAESRYDVGESPFERGVGSKYPSATERTGIASQYQYPSAAERAASRQERLDAEAELRALQNSAVAEQGADYVPSTGGVVARAGLTPSGGGDRRITKAVGADPNKPYELRYRVVDLGDLVPSNLDNGAPNPAFPAELQPRDRSRVASTLQIGKIADNLNPDALLAETGTLDRGAMIVGADNIVESGNGRVLALRQAAQNNPEKFAAYQEALRKRAAELGIDPSEFEGMRNPVLVRERVTDVDRAAFAAEANQSATLAMGTAEQAAQDAARLSDTAVERIAVGDDASIDRALLGAENRDLVRSWARTLPDNERAALLDANGNLNQSGLERLKSAILARTYVGETGQRLLTAFRESVTPIARTVQHAIMASLPDVARLEAAIRSGAQSTSYSIADDVSKAVDMFLRLKASGREAADYLGQMDMFGKETTPLQDALIEFIDRFSRSPKKLREFLRAYTDEVANLPPEGQVGMFGEVERPTKGALLDRAAKRAEAVADDAEPGLFAALDETPASPNVGRDPSGTGSVGSPDVASPRERVPTAPVAPAGPSLAEDLAGVTVAPSAPTATQTAPRAATAAQRPTGQPRLPLGRVSRTSNQIPPAQRLRGWQNASRSGWTSSASGNPALAGAPRGVRNVAAMYDNPPKTSAVDPGKIETLRRWFVRNWTDRNVDLGEVQREARKALGRPLNADEMVTEMLRVNPNAAATQRVAESVRPALIAVGEDLPWLRQYLTHMDNLDVAAAMGNDARAFSGGISADDSRQALQWMQDNLTPEQLKKVLSAAGDMRAMVNDYRQRMLDSGVWSQELFDDLSQKYPSYMPTRILDYLKSPAMGGGGRGVSLRDRGLRANTVEGTTKAREDPIASLIRYAYDGESIIRKNEAFNAFRGLVEGAPGLAPLMREVPSTYTAKNGEKIVTGFVDGVRKTYVTSSPIAEAISMEPRTSMPGFVRATTTLFRELITRTPAFVAGQVPLDAFTYLVRETARNGGPQSLPKVAQELVKAYGETFKGLLSGEFKGDAARFLKEGGGMSGLYDQSPERLRSKVSDLSRSNMFELRNKGDVMALVKWLGTNEGTQTVGQRVELAPRVASFRMAEKRGESTLQAVMRGRDVTLDFQRGGTLAKVLNDAIPFFNVGWQSAAAIPRALRENPGAFLASAAALIGTPTVSAELWNRSDPEMWKQYQDIPDYEKDRAIIWMLPGVKGTDAGGNPRPNYLKLPLREFSPFHIAARGAINAYMKDSPPRDALELIGSATTAASPIQANGPADLFSSLNPIGMNTGLQLATNQDYYRGRQIATDRNDDEASNLSKALAGVTGARPSQIEFATRDLGGGLAQTAHSLSDIGRDRGSKRIQETPIVGPMVRRFVGDSIGGNMDRAVKSMISPDVQKILIEAGMQKDAVSAVPSRITSNGESVPLTKQEQGRFQVLFNRYLREEVKEARGDPDWGEKGQRETLVRKAMSTARQRAQEDALGNLDDLEKERRVVKAAKQRAS